MSDLYGMTVPEIQDIVVSSGGAPYRTKQLVQALYKDFAPDLDSIVPLPAMLRDSLKAANAVIGTATEVRRVVSDDFEVTKLLLKMSSGTLVETVLMQYPEAGKHPRSTVCVSTQAGCAMACVFCATGQMGFQRNLSAAEIVSQVIHFARLLKTRGQHVTNVVFMGMGEPLANYDETIRAVRLLTSPETFGLAQRAVTISTVGILRSIEKLADENLQDGLAISLHSPDNELRHNLVPTAGKRSVDALLAAARVYFLKTGRRVTFEYALIDRVNDTPELAAQLAKVLRGSGAHVNLIPVNPTDGDYRRPSRTRVLAFEAVLREAGVNCTVRVEKGSEISAACGQLRTDHDRIIPIETIAAL